MTDIILDEEMGASSFVIYREHQELVDGKAEDDGVEEIVTCGMVHPTRKAGIFLVPVIHAPTVVYEEMGKSWRKRADLIVPVRIRVNEEYGSVISGETTEAGTITEAPEIIM